MKRLDRNIFNRSVGDVNIRKALSMLIYIKNHIRNSIVTDWSYAKIAQITHLSINTCRKRMKTLMNMGVISYIGIDGRHIQFDKVKSKSRRSNIRIEKLRKMSVQDIEKALKVIFVMEVQSHKEFLKHQVIKLNDENVNIRKPEYKAIRRLVVKCGMIDIKTMKLNKDYNDEGISYEYICKKLHIGYSTWHSLIKFASDNIMMNCKRNIEVEKIGRYADIALEERKKVNSKYNHSFISNGCIITFHANNYSILA